MGEAEGTVSISDGAERWKMTYMYTNTNITLQKLDLGTNMGISLSLVSDTCIYICVQVECS